MKKNITALFLICFIPYVALSATVPADSSIHELNRVVVTATKQSRNVSDLPVSASIIGKEEIELSQAKNVDDLIQYAVGAQVKRAVGMGEGVPSDIIMRGIPGALAATRTLILVDGIPTNLSGTPFLILNEIPLEAVKRIEIIRGPFSSIYGANAFGGVINIITEIGDGKSSMLLTGETSYPFTSLHNYKKDTREHGADFWKENAKLAYWNGSVLAGAGNEKVDILASGGYRTIGNYYLKDSALVRKGTNKHGKDISNHDYTDYRLLLKNGWHISDRLKNTAHIRLFKSELGFGKTGTVPNEDVIVEGQKFLIGDYLDYDITENLHAKLGGFFRVVDGNYDDKADSVIVSGTMIKKNGSVVPTFWDARSRDIQGEGSVVFHPLAAHTVIAGFDVLHNKIHFGALKYRSTDETRAGESDVDKTFWNSGLYAQDDIKFKWLNIIPACRLDYHSQFGFMLSPKLGLSSRLRDRFTLRASAGNAFRAPSTTELYGSIITGSVKIKGNPDLKPERVTSTDGGFEADILPGMSILSNVFYNDMTNLISLSFGDDILSRVVNNQPLEVTHGNVSSAYSWGLENELTVSRFNPFKLTLSYTFTQSENQENGRQLDYIPTHKASGTVGFSKNIGSGKLNVNIQELFVGKREYLDYSTDPVPQFRLGGTTYVFNYVTLKPYWKTDFSISYSFRNNHTVLLTAQNCFNADIEESGGTYSPGMFYSVKYSAPISFK